MATKPSKKTKAKSPPTTNNTTQSSRFWLMYPPKLIKNPVIWELTKRFPVITNVRQASVTDEIGIVSLELTGKRSDIKAALKWLEKLKIKVEPVEINIIES
ncbi:MAG: NIL domain-containing protein [Opitutaceae bacterium]|nr:NIL domain-containing protein [Verrucomicrobiales bacterium]